MDKKFPKLSQRNKKVEDGISIIGGNIYDPKPSIRNEHVFIHSGLIAYTGKINNNLLTKSASIINAHGYKICPGFIDMHTYGAYGIDTHTCTEDELTELSYRFPRHGVTTFLPSVGAGSKNIIKSAFQSTYRAMKKESGAEILGIYIEGLCANPNKRGAQRDIGNLCSLDDLSKIIREFPETLKILMLAPELDNSARFKSRIEKTEKNTIFAVGHSDASYAITINAFNNGYNLVTHLFNAMSLFSSGRELGVVGAALISKEIFVEVILDGVHVAFELVKLAFQAKNRGKFISITDSCSHAGLPIDNQEIIFLGQRATVTNRGLILDDGKLAASTLTLNRALENLVDKCGISFDDALSTITSNPANCLGIADRKGYIKRGHDGDIVLLNSDLSVLLTIGKGKILYNKLPRKRIERF
ncbi:MAG: N-acetylglucosamine-6-phosphate deacetylase [Chloroflexi bacterium]|nr:N-acetylglucosamine-6-phosphate deacetylase [Chloroflexota bacterium]